MSNVKIILTVLTIFSMLAASMIAGCDQLGLKNSEIVNSLISLFAAFGALVSAVLVVATGQDHEYFLSKAIRFDLPPAL